MEPVLSRLREYASVIDREGVVSSEFLDMLWRYGFLSITCPEEYGGSGLGLEGLVDVVVEIAKISIPVASIVLIHGGSVLSVLGGVSDEGAREELLSRMCRGSIAAVSITEPGGGSDIVASTRTRAVLRDGEWIVSGEKVFTSNGLYAGLFLVLARTGEGKRDFSLIVVPRSERVSVESLDLTAFRGAGIARVVYREASAPSSWVVGGPGGGFRAALGLINYGRIAYAAMGLGATLGLVREAVEYGAGRVLFGQRLIDFQGPRWALGDLYARAVVLGAALRETVREATRRGEVDPVMAAILKYEASRLAVEAARTALQLHGGRGLERHSLTERMLRDTVALGIGEGSNEVLLDYISKTMVKEFTRSSGIA